MATTTGSSGIVEEAKPKARRVNKLVEAIAQASKPEVMINVADVVTPHSVYVPSPQETAKYERQQQVKHDRDLFREALTAFIAALEVKHPAHIGAAVLLAEEYVKIVNMRYPLDLS
jgi:hypothetical protein